MKNVKRGQMGFGKKYKRGLNGYPLPFSVPRSKSPYNFGNLNRMAIVIA